MHKRVQLGAAAWPGRGSNSRKTKWGGVWGGDKGGGAIDRCQTLSKTHMIASAEVRFWAGCALLLALAFKGAYHASIAVAVLVVVAQILWPSTPVRLPSVGSIISDIC